MIDLLYNLIVLPYPIFRSMKALTTGEGRLLNRWLIFWSIFGIFKVFEPFADITFFWFPLYSSLKLVFVLACEVESLKIPELFYNTFFRIFFDVMFNSKYSASRTGSFVGKSGSIGNILSNLTSSGTKMTTSSMSTSGVPISTGIPLGSGVPASSYKERDISYAKELPSRDLQQGTYSRDSPSRDRGYYKDDWSGAQQIYSREKPVYHQGYAKDEKDWSSDKTFANKDLPGVGYKDMSNVGFAEKSTFSRSSDQSIH